VEPFLRSRGLLGSAAGSAARVEVEDISMSHQAYRVWLDGELRWFVKRGDTVRSRGRDLGAESAVYRLAGRNTALAAVVPRCWLIDDRAQVVVLDAIPGGAVSPEVAWAATAGDEETLAACGDVLARVHAIRPPRLGAKPWLLDGLQPLWDYSQWLPPGCAALLSRLAASPAVRFGFAQARRTWRPTALVHGDLRWTNLVRDGRPAAPAIRLVDWELACVGDPAWDVGSVIADIVATTLLWCPTAQRLDPVAPATHFLRAYRASAMTDDASWPAFVIRSVRLAGVRLVQTMVEYGHGSDEEFAAAREALVPWLALWFDQPEAIGLDLAESARLEPAAA
jgi:aminoglycoside phosphotransferase (APT) family kinase protein